MQESWALMLSDDISSPIVVGVIRPCVLLPRDLFNHASPETLKHVMNHELAHVRRGDLWIAWVQALGLAVYWWSPILRLICSRLDTTREMACDEHAVAITDDPINYANALLASTRSAIMCSPHRHTLAVGIFESPAALSRRVEALLGMESGKSIHNRRAIALVSLGLIVASTSLTLLATPRLGPARSTDTTTEAPLVNNDASALIDAVVNKRLDEIRTLVGNGADVNALQPGDGTALTVAAKRGDIGMLHELIGLGADVNKASPGDGTPLIVAAKHGDLTEARALIGSGANVNEPSIGDGKPRASYRGNSLLRGALRLGCIAAGTFSSCERQPTPACTSD